MSDPRDHRIPIMMSAAEVKAIDDWSFENRVRTRSKAIRQAMMLGINAEEKSAQAYQVIGQLLSLCGMFESDEGQRALDYFSQTERFDPEFLPWPAGAFPDRMSEAELLEAIESLGPRAA